MAADFRSQRISTITNKRKRLDLMSYMDETGHSDDPNFHFAYGALVTGIVTSNPIPIGVIVSVKAFRTLSERQQSAFLDPYYVAFQRCTRGAAAAAAYSDPPEKVAMVYSYNEEFGATKSQEPYSVNQAGRAEQLC